MQDPLNFLSLNGKIKIQLSSLLKKCLERQTSVPQVSFHFSVGSAFFYKRRQILMTASQITAVFGVYYSAIHGSGYNVPPIYGTIPGYSTH